jgi:hypothetical protein
VKKIGATLVVLRCLKFNIIYLVCSYGASTMATDRNHCCTLSEAAISKYRACEFAEDKVIQYIRKLPCMNWIQQQKPWLETVVGVLTFPL